MGLQLKPSESDWWILRGLFYGAMLGALGGVGAPTPAMARLALCDGSLTGAVLGLIGGLLVARTKRQGSKHDHGSKARNTRDNPNGHGRPPGGPGSESGGD